AAISLSISERISGSLRVVVVTISQLMAPSALLLEQKAAHAQGVEPRGIEGGDRVPGGAGDRLRPGVQGRVEQQRYPGALGATTDQLVERGVAFPADALDAGRAVDVHDRRDLVPALRADVEVDDHVGSVPRCQEVLVGLLGQYRRRQRTPVLAILDRAID